MNSNTTTFLSTGDRTEPYRAVFDPPRTPERPFPHGLRAAAPSFVPGSAHISGHAKLARNSKPAGQWVSTTR